MSFGIRVLSGTITISRSRGNENENSRRYEDVKMKLRRYHGTLRQSMAIPIVYLSPIFNQNYGAHSPREVFLSVQGIPQQSDNMDGVPAVARSIDLILTPLRDDRKKSSYLPHHQTMS